MHITISGFPPDTKEEDLRTPLEEFGAKILDITIQPSKNEAAYMAIVEVDTDATGSKALAGRIDGILWRGNKLRARYYLFIK
jgi:hypothetical protein